jgi:hypothetical protein
VTDFGVQNAEPGSALVALGGTNFSDLAPDTYTVTVLVYGCDTTVSETNLLATDAIQLDAVPEPGTIPCSAARSWRWGRCAVSVAGACPGPRHNPRAQAQRGSVNC